MTVVVTQLPFVVAQFVWRSLVVGAPHFGTFAGEFMAKQPQNTHQATHTCPPYSYVYIRASSAVTAHSGAQLLLNCW